MRSLGTTKTLCKEHLHREFFKQYLQKIYKKQDIIIDSPVLLEAINDTVSKF